MRSCGAVAVVRHSCHGGGVLEWVKRRRSLVVLTFVVSVLFELSCRQIVGIKPRNVPCGDDLMIDNFEDGDGFICNTLGRQGAWRTFGDKTSTDFTPPENQAVIPTQIPGGRDGSQHAVRFKGSAFSDWGGGIGLALNGPGLSAGKPYDASRTTGIKFWMKSNVRVTVALPTMATIPGIKGGACLDTAAEDNCENHFAFQITPPDPDAWVEYEVPFASLVQPDQKTGANGGQIFGSASFNPSGLVKIDFRVDSGSPFDVWIDDVTFAQCHQRECGPTCKSPTIPVTLCPVDDFTAACRPMAVGCANQQSQCDSETIDNLEDNDTTVCNAGGRYGYWFAVGDDPTSPSLQPAPFMASPIPEGQGYAAHFSGSGFSKWGALMGFSLGVKRGAAQPYDLSPYGAIKFWMKANAPVSVQLRMPETTADENGGECVGTFDDNGCEDHFQFEIAAPNPNEWTEYTVPFDALTKRGSGGSAVWNPSRIVSITFNVPPDYTFDVWVDDIRLDTCTSLTGCPPTCTDPAAPKACPPDGDFSARCVSAAVGCSGSTSHLFDVWGTDSRDVWVAGEKGVAHWDGSAWSALTATPTTEILECVWGSGPSNVWAVGYGGAIVHWNGSFWSPVTSGTPNRLESVWGTSPRDVWAIGENGTIVHWNGFAWSTFASGTTAFFIGNVWGSGPTDVWAVGGGGIVAHWDGAAWSLSRIEGIGVLFGLWGSGPNDVWAVGGAEPAVAVPDQQIVHWDGAAWTKISSGTTELLFGVWGSGPNDLWAVGDAGTIIHWSGAGWSVSNSGTTEDLRDVWGSGPNDVWVVGRNGTLLHWDGVAWSSRSIPRK